MINNFLDKEGLQILWEIIKDNDNQLEESIKNIICPGYFYEGEFYIDDQHIRKYVPYTYKLYIEVSTSKIYAYTNNDDFNCNNRKCNNSSSYSTNINIYDITNRKFYKQYSNTNNISINSRRGSSNAVLL